MNNNKDIFERMHEKMTPSREAEDELFARAAAIERGESDPSADTETFGGIIMNRTIKESTHETELHTVRSRKGGIIAAAAAAAMALGVGGYTALGGRLGVDDVSSKAAASQSAAEEEETDSAEIQPETGTVTATTETDVPALTEAQARQMAAEVLGVPENEIEFETIFVLCDHGIECYEFDVNYNGINSVTVTVPTGYITEPDEKDDPFMTETAAGQALTDAGVAHDEFGALAVYEYQMNDEAGKKHSGWVIQFLAKGGKYYYFIDDKGEIVNKERFELISEGKYENTADTKKPEATMSTTITPTVTPELAHEYMADLLGEAVDVNDITIIEETKESDFGVESYMITAEYGGKRYSFNIPTGLVTKTAGFDHFMTETAAGMALTAAGIGHDQFTALAANEAEKIVEGKKLSGWEIQVLMGQDLRHYFFIDDMGRIVDQHQSFTDLPACKTFIGNEITEEEAKETAARINGFDRYELEFLSVKTEDYNGTPAYTLLFKPDPEQGFEDNTIRTAHISLMGDDLDHAAMSTAPIEVTMDTGANDFSLTWTVLHKTDDTYIRRSAEAFDSAKTEASKDMPDMTGAMWFSAEIDGKTYKVSYDEGFEQLVEVDGKTYTAPEDTWNALTDAIMCSTPHKAIRSSFTDENEKTCKKALKENGADISGGKLSFVLDIDYKDTLKPAWVVTLEADGKTDTYVIDPETEELMTGE